MQVILYEKVCMHAVIITCPGKVQCLPANEDYFSTHEHPCSIATFIHSQLPPPKNRHRISEAYICTAIFTDFWNVWYLAQTHLHPLL